jgi:hypothetical protein
MISGLVVLVYIATVILFMRYAKRKLGLFSFYNGSYEEIGLSLLFISSFVWPITISIYFLVRIFKLRKVRDFISFCFIPIFFIWGNTFGWALASPDDN